MKIIVAQGNPEPEYESSRHNIGFMVVNAIAEKLDEKWANKPKFHAIIAEVKIDGEKALLVKPTTFYNDTGLSVRSLVDFYKLNPADDLLIIHDDLALPFGSIRVRKQGSDAGNNGIKSVNSVIDQNYTRIRIGTCNELREKIGDVDFVLAKFSVDESDQLKDKIIPQAIELVHQFCKNTLQTTSHKII